MARKNVLYLIGSLGIGGAEVLLVNTIKLLSVKYNFIVVYFNEPNTLLSELAGIEVINLNYKGKLDILSASLRLKKIISVKKVDIVHAHLFWPTIIGRLGTPNDVKFVFTVHSILSKDAFSANRLSLLAEKITYTKKQIAIFVSKAARDDYDKHVGLKGEHFVVNNFIGDAFYLEQNQRGNNFTEHSLKLVSVGNLKEAKNFPFLLAALEKLKGLNITLDIYGEGHLRNYLQNEIEKRKLNSVRLCGSNNNVAGLLKKYDLFVLSSIYEGFALAPLEAMAVGLPCMLPNIPPLHEVAEKSALFFNLSNESDFVNKILDLYNNSEKLVQLAKLGVQHAEKYKNHKFSNAIINIYDAK